VNFKTTLRLLLMVCLLGLALWVLKAYVGPQKRREALRQKLVEFDSEDIRQVRIRRGKLDVELARDEDGWRVVRPVRARANPGGIDEMLSVLERTLRMDVVSLEDRRERELTLDHYGLAEPRARLTVGNGLRQVDLEIGGDAPLGGQLFVQIAGDDSVLACSGGLYASLPVDLASIRDRRVLSGMPARTTRLEISSPAGGFMKLQRSPEGWTFLQPDVGRGDDTAIARLLDTIYGLQVETFVEDAHVEAPAAGETELPENPMAPTYEQYDLVDDKAVLRLRVYTQGDEVGRELLFGKATGENTELIFVRQADIPSVYAVKREILDRVKVSVNDLRSRRLFGLDRRNIAFMLLERDDRRLKLRRARTGAWQIEEPVRWPADYQTVRQTLDDLTRIQIADFVEASQTNLVRLGLSPPAWSVVLARNPAVASAGRATVPDTPGPGAAFAEHRLLIGHGRAGQKGFYVGFENRVRALAAADKITESFIYRVDPEPLASLARRATDPLVYRNRTMLALETKHVSRLTLRRGTTTQAVQRNEAGAWTPVDVATNVANNLAIDATLFHLANLRAATIVAHNPEKPEQFGLTAGGTSLTVGLTGSQAIQKTLLIGKAAGRDGIYAMVQGQDVVFVLPGKVAAQLRRKLHRPAGTTEKRGLFEVPLSRPVGKRGAAATGAP
jgi:hypothetical protein